MSDFRFRIYFDFGFRNFDFGFNLISDVGCSVSDLFLMLDVGCSISDYLKSVKSKRQSVKSLFHINFMLILK